MAGSLVSASSVTVGSPSGTADVTYSSNSTIGEVWYTWGPPASGSMYLENGHVFVKGASSMSNLGGGYANHHETLDVLQQADGSIHLMEQVGFWVIDASAEYTLSAGAVYTRNGGSLEPYRAEATCAAEVSGDFSAFGESQVVMDSYSTTGTSYYDTQGGGTSPVAYRNGAWRSVVRGPGPSSGIDANVKTFGCYCQQVRWANSVSFQLYARGKHYHHNDHEEAVSIETSILFADDSEPGWVGTLVAYDSTFTPIWTFAVAADLP